MGSRIQNVCLQLSESRAQKYLKKFLSSHLATTSIKIKFEFYSEKNAMLKICEEKEDFFCSPRDTISKHT